MSLVVPYQKSFINLALQKQNTYCLTMNAFPPTVYNTYSVSLANHSRLNSAAVILAFVFQGILTL